MKKATGLKRIILSLILLLTACAGGGFVETADNIPPTTPTNLKAGADIQATISLSWNASTDNVAVRGYSIFRDGIYLKSVTGNSTSDSDVIPGIEHCYTVYAYDSANISADSNKSCASAQPDPTDSTPPSVPADLLATPADSTSISLSWDASTDDKSVRGYRIYKNGAYLKTVTGTTAADTGLNAFSQYCYSVSAIDGGLNESAQTVQSCATTSWILTTIDGPGLIDNYSSIAVDAAGKAHISYYDFSSAALKYATNATGLWIAAPIGSTGMGGQDTSIGVDSTGRVHISYRGDAPFRLGYVTNATGSWVASDIDTAINTEFSSLKVDSKDKVHVSYYDASYGLKYVTNASGSWIAEIVEGGAGWFTSLGVDVSGKAHISYYDFTRSYLKYATNTSGAWVTATVDSVGNVGESSSLAMDGFGKAHISYYDVTNADLKYATNASGAWVTKVIDSMGDEGAFSSIAVDLSGGVHISYEDSSNHNLKYATNASGVWKTYTIDGVGRVEGHTSIAVDSSGKVHISYRGNGSLMYATNQ